MHIVSLKGKWRQLLVHLSQLVFGGFEVEAAKRLVRCGACGELGHTRRAKVCPLYKSQETPNMTVNDDWLEELRDALLLPSSCPVQSTANITRSQPSMFSTLAASVTTTTAAIATAAALSTCMHFLLSHC
jgi:hypothetical protein